MLLVNMATGAAMVWLTHHLATGNALRFYPQTLWVICQAGVAAAMALAGLATHRHAGACLWISSLLIGLLGIPWLVAMISWPGGDDGGAFGWFFLAGGGCAVSMVVALITWAIGWSDGPARKAAP